MVGGEVKFFKDLRKEHNQIDDCRNRDDQSQLIKDSSLYLVAGGTVSYWLAREFGYLEEL